MNFKILFIFTPIFINVVCFPWWTDMNTGHKWRCILLPCPLWDESCLLDRFYLLDITLPIFSYSLLSSLVGYRMYRIFGSETMFCPILLILSSELIGYRKKHFVQKNSFNCENLWHGYFRCGYACVIL